MSWQGQVDAWGRPVEHTGGAADATQQAWAAHAAAQQQYAQHVATGYGQHAQGTATQYGQANPQQQASAYQQAYQQHYQQNAYQQNAYQQTAYQQTAYQQPHAQAGTKQLVGKDGPGQPGNWFCPSCNNENWPSRHSCNRCKVPKPGGQNGGVQAVHNTGGGGLQVKNQPGDAGNWRCPGCNNENWPQRTSCNRCRTPRGAAQALMGQAQVQQNSAALAAHNQSTVGQNSHGVPPAHNGGGPATGNWPCPACNNDNYPHRTVCNRCQVVI